MFNLFQGGDLDHKIIQYKKQGKTFPEPIIIEWLIQLLLAVQYMHSRYIYSFMYLCIPQGLQTEILIRELFEK